MEGNELTRTGAQLLSGQHVVIEGGHMTVGNQQVVIEQEGQGTSEGGSESVETIQVQDGGDNVVYIVQQEGMEGDGVTYAVMEDGSGAQTFAIQTEDGVDPSSLGLTEEKLLEAISSGQYQIVQSVSDAVEDDQQMTTGLADQYTISSQSTDTDTGMVSHISTVDILTTEQDRSDTKYMRIHGREVINVVNTDNVEFVFTCQFCEKSAASLEELKQHIAEDHDASIIEGYDTDMVTVLSSCAHCDKTFSSDTEFQAHILKHEQETGSMMKSPDTRAGTQRIGSSTYNKAGSETSFYKCPWCPKMFSAKLKSSLNAHILQTHPGNDPKKSQIIYINRVHLSDVQQESKSHSQGSKAKKVNCNICGLLLADKASVSKHLKEEHPEVNIDDYVITSDTMADSKFPCLLCDKVFRWPKSLKSHMIDIHSSDTDVYSSKTSSPRKSGKDAYFGCSFCDLVTRYACSVRLHMKRKHPEMVEGIDVNKMDIRVVENANPTEVISLDKRPAEIRLRKFAKIFRCPFCSYATQLPSNLTRHLTSKNHKHIFTNEELRQIKVSSFRVNVDKSQQASGKLPELKFTKSVKTIVDDKKRRLGLPVVENDLLLDVQDISYSEIFDDEEQEMTEQNEDESTDGKHENSTSVEALDSSRGMVVETQDHEHARKYESKSDGRSSEEKPEKSDGSVLSEMLLSKSPLKVIRDRPVRPIENKNKGTSTNESTVTSLIKTPLKTYERKRKIENTRETEKNREETLKTLDDSSSKTDEKTEEQPDESVNLDDGNADTPAEKELAQAKTEIHKQTTFDESGSQVKNIVMEDGTTTTNDSAGQNKNKVMKRETIVTVKTPTKFADSNTVTMLKKPPKPTEIKVATTLKSPTNVMKSKTAAKMKTVKCVVCPRECEGIKSVLHHAATHENATVAFKCKNCNKQFPFFVKLKDHLRSAHSSETDIVTPIEAVMMNKEANVQKKPVTTYDCPYCEVILSSATPLQQHITLDHEKHLNVISLSSSGKKMVSGYNCFYCELSYISVIDLVRHMHIIHPGVERPGEVEDQSNTPARKSSRKRKLPKWLENDMNVGEEKSPKKRKTEAMPVRVSSLSMTELGENKADVTKPAPVTKVKIISQATVSYGKKVKRSVEVNTGSPAQTQIISDDKTKAQSKSSTSTPPKDITMHTKESEKKQESIGIGKGTEKMQIDETASQKKETIKSKVETKKVINEKPKTPKAGRKSTTGKIDPVLLTPTEVIQELKCPHCDFTAKRSSALNFHVNFNHKNSNAEVLTVSPEGSESQTKMNLYKDAPAEESSKKTQKQEEKEQSVSDERDTTHSESKEADYAGFVDYEDAGTLDDDYDKDYTPGTKLSSNESPKLVSVDKATSQSLQLKSKNKKTFVSARQLKLHIQANHADNLQEDPNRPENKETGFNCAYCKQCYRTSNAVKVHIQTVHGKNMIDEKDDLSVKSLLSSQKVYKCPVCQVLSNSVERILLHVEVKHPLESDVSALDIKQYTIAAKDIQVKFVCPYCTFKSKWKSAVTRHVERHHSDAKDFKSSAIAFEPEMTEKQFTCPYCLGQMDSIKAVLAHAEQYHSSAPQLTSEDVKNAGEMDPENLIKCPFCSMHSKYKRCIVRHISRIHPGKSFDASQLEDKEHLRKVYRCCYCPLETQHLSSLMRHLKRNHPEHNIQAMDPETMISEPTMDNTNKEINTSKVKPIGRKVNHPDNVADGCLVNNLFYRCPMCKVTDRKKEVIFKHITRHNGAEEYNMEDVIVEMRTSKTDRTIFVCRYCKQTMISLDRLKEHAAILHGQRKLDYKTGTLKRHQEVVNAFNCPSCNYLSYWRRLVLKHIEDVHPEVRCPTLGSITCKLMPIKDAKDIDSEFFGCPFCDIRCKWKKSVIRHIKTAHPNKPVHCTIPTIPLQSISDHAGSKKGTKILKCKRCSNQTFKSVPQLRKHYIQYHPEHAENCLKSENFEYQYQTLPVSAIVGTDQGGVVRDQHRCMICQARYMWKKSLVTHIKAQHSEQQEVYMALDRIVDIVVNAAEDSENGNKQKANSAGSDKQMGTTAQTRTIPPQSASERKCGLCNAVFHNKWKLRTHYQLKHGQAGRKRIYRTGLSSFQKTCRSCGIGFFTRSALLTHTLKAHRNRPRSHTCRCCGQSRPDARSLAFHKILCRYQSQMLYMCKVDGCDYTIRFKSLLQTHMWREHGLKEENLHNANLRCELCDQKMTSLNELLSHIRKHQQNKLPCLYPCALCGLKLTSVSQRDEHIAIMHRGVAEMCDICGESLPNKSKLEIHLKKHEEKKLMPCPMCAMTVRSIDLSNHTHYVKHHPELLACGCDICQGVVRPVRVQDVYRCGICNKYFCEKLKLMCHNQAVHGSVKVHGKKNRPFPCKMCSDVFFTYKSLILHISQMHNVRNVLKQENQGLNQVERIEPMRMESELNESGENQPTTHVIHIGQGENNQYLPRLGEVSLNAVIKELVVYDASARHPYKCILCGRSFNRSKYIKLHIRRAHVKDENQPYRCKLCGSGFVRLTEFRKHTRAHSDFRPYKCKVCNKAFKQQANLKEHYFIHSEVKNFQCMLCRKTFKQRGALTSHVVGHDTLKPFKCSFCGKGFTVRGELSKHMKKYDMESAFNETKSFTCHMCMESFTHFPLLLKHIDQHNPEKPFHCNVCQVRFSNYVAMYFHKCDNQHFTTSDITKALQQVARKGMVTRRQRYERRKPIVSHEMDVSQPMQETIYLSQNEDGTMIPNAGSTIEVIIGDIDQHAVVQVEEKQPEHDELLSIAQQLTELSSIAEKGSLLKEEDEIIKNMLDADAEVLANLHKHSSSSDYDSKWEDSSPSKRKSLVRSYLEQPTPVVTRSHVPEDKIYIPGLESESNDQVLEDGQIEIQMDVPVPVSGQSVLPTNLEELAHLISQNNDGEEQNNVLAYHNEDGSVVYVCMPDKNGQNIYSESHQIIETQEAAQNIPSDTIIVENDEGIQAVVDEPELDATTDMNNAKYPSESFVIDGTQLVKLERSSEPNDYSEMVEEDIVQEMTHADHDYGGEEHVAQGQESQENMEVEGSAEAQHKEMAEAEEIIEATAVDMTEVYEDAVEDGEEYVAEQIAGPSQEAGNIEEEGVQKNPEQVVEYQDNETTFIKEELLDVEYQQAVEQNEELMVMYGNFKYTFVKDEKCFTCLHCDTKISNYKNLKGHLQRHLPEKHRPFQCTFCQKRFITKNELKRHIRIHSGEKNHECLYCKKRFVQSGQLAEHVRTHTGEKPFKCSECPASFTTGTQCKQHWHRNHGKNVIPCSQCDQLFKTMPDLTRHKGRMHSSLSKPRTRQQTKVVEGGDHVCHICGDGFAERSSLMAHLFQHSMENVSFQCSECDKEFRSKESLNTHKKAKHTGEEHNCTICGETFSWKTSLQRHVQVRHPPPEDEGKARTDFTCDDCGKSFATAASLTYHMGSQHVS